MAYPQDHFEDEFLGLQIESEAFPGTHYTIKKPIGGGSMGTVYFALHQISSGLAPAVIKIISPTVVAQNENAAMLMVKKEAVALGRINERVPPTPFVVHLFEAGFLPLTARRRLALPWLALEYVHGGLQGTTLSERVEHSVRSLGHAFDLERAAGAIRCLVEGLTAIHEAGVIHRDVTPGNVLCCGFGADETLKIADFGVARPVGMRGTFNAVMLGTPGYSAPEQAFSGYGEVSRASDVFSLAAVVFHVLTGQHYFDTDNAAHALLLAKEGRGKKLADCQLLCPELRGQTALLRALDNVFAQATAAQPTQRPTSVDVFGSTILGLLGTSPKSVRSPHRISGAIAEVKEAQVKGPEVTEIEWNVREAPSSERLVYSAGWGGDGSCLAITSFGIEFWSGSGWKTPSAQSAVPLGRLRFSSLCKPGVWLLGGSDGSLVLYSGSDQERLEPGAPRLIYLQGSGNPDDLAVLAAQTPDGAHMLCAQSARRWLKPLPLPQGTVINDLCRVGDAAWLVCGREGTGAGFIALYEPLMWGLTRVATTAHALVACTAIAEGQGVSVGPGGAVLRVKGLEHETSELEGHPNLSAIAADASQRVVAGAAGALWELNGNKPNGWRRLWHNPTWSAPFISIFADVGLTYAMTAEGAIVEGRIPLAPR